MQIIINDKPCHARIGQTLSKAARLNHSHVGYLCGAHGVCQTCQVRVLEGAEHLSPPNDVEQAFLTPEQLSDGIRMACRATIISQGSIKVLSRPEEVRRMFFSNPLPLFSYGAEIGRGVVSQALPGLGNLVGRIAKGELMNEEELEELKDSVEGVIGLTVETLPEYLPFREQVEELMEKLPARLPFELPPELPSVKLPITLPLLEDKARKGKKGAVAITYTPPGKSKDSSRTEPK